MSLSSPRPNTPRKQRLPIGPSYPAFGEVDRKLLRAPPTRYQPAFAEAVIEDLSQGYSLGGFAGRIGVSRRTLNSWMESHPDFKQACARAMAMRQRWWETKALEVAETGGRGSQGQMVIFGLINAGRDDWRNRAELGSADKVSLSAAVEAAMNALQERLRSTEPTVPVRRTEDSGIDPATPPK